MKTNGRLRSVALALASLIIFVSLVSSTAMAQVTVHASFDANPSEGDAPLTVHFKETTTISPGAYVNSPWWDFGDGIESQKKNPTHTYHTPGTYTVTLIESASTPVPADQLGQDFTHHTDDSTSRVITVYEP